MARALINNDIMVWARERASKSIDDLADALKIREETLQKWEEGVGYPTFRQAQSLAKKLHVPFGYLFLKEPPKLQLAIPDLRTVGSQQKNKFSLEFEDILNDSKRKQAWYKELLLKDGVDPLPFVGRYSVNDQVEEVADNIRETLEITQSFRKESSSWEIFLSRLIDRVEAKGILVLRNGVVGNNNNRPLDVTEFRGFVLSDPYAPLIFLNNKDAQSAKIFTLAHELAHLWIGESGVTNYDPIQGEDSQTAQIEKFCNAVAAEVLVPEQDILNMWLVDKNIDHNLNQLCKHFRVSPLVILIRARNLKLISQTDFNSEYPMHTRKRAKSKSSSGNFNNTLPVRNSKRFTKTLISETLEGNTLYREAAQLLGVKVNTIQSLAEHLQIH